MNTQTTYLQTLSSSSIHGTDVKNMQGEDLGSVEDLMIDLQEGRIAYAVLSFGGFLGIGNKLFAVPWSALTVNTEDECLILDVNKDRLENAPGFDKDNWPQNPDMNWYGEVYSYYEQTPYWDNR